MGMGNEGDPDTHNVRQNDQESCRGCAQSGFKYIKSHFTRKPFCKGLYDSVALAEQKTQKDRQKR